MGRGLFEGETFNRRITMSYEEYDDKGNITAQVKRCLIDDDTELLDYVVGEMLYFLHGMTFTYVTQLVPKGANGDEITPPQSSYDDNADDEVDEDS